MRFRAKLGDIKIIGRSSQIRRNLALIDKIAKTDKNVLILGETGTGKDLAARKLHHLSNRRDRPFIAINCNNIPEDLFEAELFGFARGAFTGAIREKPGLLEVAQKGTVFIDEVGDLSLPLQAKLLRILEEKKLRRIGETRLRKIDVRFIFATNKDLQQELNQNKFRRDLYYRINVIKLYMPPLRERREDIPLLIKHILSKENNGNKKKITRAARNKLMAYDFPGNIRELENIIERASILADNNMITDKDIVIDFDYDGVLEKNWQITPRQLRRTLEKCRWNKTKAATEIGKSRRQFYRLLEKYQMTDYIRKN